MFGDINVQLMHGLICMSRHMWHGMNMLWHIFNAFHMHGDIT